MQIIIRAKTSGKEERISQEVGSGISRRNLLPPPPTSESKMEARYRL